LIIRSRLSVRKWIQEKHFGCGIVAIAGVWTSLWEASPDADGTGWEARFARKRRLSASGDASYKGAIRPPFCCKCAARRL